MPAFKKSKLPLWVQEEFARLDNTINRQCRQYQELLAENATLLICVKALIRHISYNCDECSKPIPGEPELNELVKEIMEQYK